jgi:hypothetical protein
MDCFFNSFFSSCFNNEKDEEVSLLNYLKNLSAEVQFRSNQTQLESLEKDGSLQKAYETLKLLVKKYHYTISRIELVITGLNIWLYSIPTPPGSVSINPSTKFQHHRVLRVYLGTHSDWMIFQKEASKDVKFNIDDSGFEEKE